MSEFVIEVTPENGKRGKGVIRDGVLCYIKLQDGAYKYNSTTEKEYTVDVVVDKATYKAFKKEYPRNSAKEYDNEDFVKRFKIDPPFKGDEQYVVKVKTKAQFSKDYKEFSEGDMIPYDFPSRPKMYLEEGEGIVDVTMSTLAANGSKGHVAFNISVTDFGVFPQLSGVLVTNLIEYEGGYEDSSPFGHVVGKKTGEVRQVATVHEDEQYDVDEDSIPF